MKETCINCGKWRGLHKWDTMQCPFDEKESGLFLVNQFYAEENAELAALRAQNAELIAALDALMKRAVKDAEKYQPDSSSPIWAYIEDASDILAKVKRGGNA